MADSEGAGVGGDANPWITFGASLVVLVAVTAAYHGLEHNKEIKLRSHLIYWAISILVILVLPTSIAQYIFSPLAATIVGTCFPIYESVRAICTPDEDDDKEWLQYWMVGGVFFMVTTWIDDVIQSDRGTGYWFMSVTFLYFWLYFPKTNGALVIYEKVTEPFVAPRLRPLQSKLNNFITYIYQTLINAVHLWILWLIFMFLPSGLKRIIAIAIGTIYPFVSSVGAATTEEVEDDTYWLTYWSCYGCLFLIMDVLETWLGWIPGFYSLIIFSTVYLMLPMFQGSDKIFRKILVPAAGLQEMLLLRDAMKIKKQLFKDLDPERAKTVRKAIAKFYDDDADESGDPKFLKRELMTSWRNINPFAKRKNDAHPSETSNLV